MYFLATSPFPVNFDFGNVVGVVGGLIGIVGPAIAIIVTVVRSRTDNDKTRAEIDAMIQNRARDALKDEIAANTRLEQKVDELDKKVMVLEERATLAEDKASRAEEAASVLTRGFSALWSILERSRGHAKATPEEEEMIEAARALIAREDPQ